MRNWTLRLAVLSLLAAACAPQEYRPDTPAQYLTADGCAQVNRDNLHAAAGYANAYLTVATGDPAFPPWWEGGTTDEHPEWRLNDPYLGQGFEGAVTFEVSERLGFSEDRVRFVSIGFNESFAPGPKRFDFVLQQISFLPERSEAVDFSEGYYDVHQAMVSVEVSPIATATSLEDLKDATLGAPNGTTSLTYIEDTIQPSTPPAVYDDLSAAVRDLKRGGVDGIVVDLDGHGSPATDRTLLRGRRTVGEVPRLRKRAGRSTARPPRPTSQDSGAAGTAVRDEGLAGRGIELAAGALRAFLPGRSA